MLIFSLLLACAPTPKPDFVDKPASIHTYADFYPGDAFLLDAPTYDLTFSYSECVPDDDPYPPPCDAGDTLFFERDVRDDSDPEIYAHIRGLFYNMYEGALCSHGGTGPVTCPEYSRAFGIIRVSWWEE